MYSKDTRSIQTGDIYVAIKGESFDGHQFAQQALDKGAARVVIETPMPELPQDKVELVENSIQYLVQEAQKRIQKFNPKIVAITGSIGKTSTRQAIVSVLATQFNVVQPEGNLNTPLGLALTILNGLNQENTILVLEMGARFVGDINELSTYFQPDISVVTNVYGVHVETFGSLENIGQEKGKLVENLKTNGTACLNADNEVVKAMAHRTKAKVILFSAKDNSYEVNPTLIPSPYPILGDHAIYLILAAYSVAKALEMAHEDIIHGIQQIKSPKGRLSKLQGINNSILIDDTYNASPEATANALSLLKKFPNRKIAFIGDMLELGTDELEKHFDTAITALEAADEVILVGSRMGAILARLKTDKPLHHFTDALSAVKWLTEAPLAISADCAILVKGSQGTRMEHISKALLSPQLNPKDVLVRQDTTWLSS